MTKMESTVFGIPPNLDDLKNPNSYRLACAKGAMTSLQKELVKYENVSKKYGKSKNVFSWITGVSGTLSVGLSAAGLRTGPGAIVGLPLGVIGVIGVIGGIFGLVACLGNFASKKIKGKVLKHDKTITLAKSKIYSIQELVSKALEDGNIGDAELASITNELHKYEVQKSEIRGGKNNPVGIGGQKADTSSVMIQEKIAKELQKIFVFSSGLAKWLSKQTHLG